jgi:hypothetical protein
LLLSFRLPARAARQVNLDVAQSAVEKFPAYQLLRSNAVQMPTWRELQCSGTSDEMNNRTKYLQRRMERKML